MTKFKKCFARYGVLACTVAILISCLAIPSLAVGAGGSSQVFSVLPFDYIVSEGDFVCEWPYNASERNSLLTGWRFDLYPNGITGSSTPMLTGLAYYDNSRIAGYFRAAQTSSFYLYTESLVFANNNSYSALLTWDMETVDSPTISISFRAGNAVVNDGVWEIEYERLEATYTPTIGTFNLYNAIYNMLSANDYTADYVHLTNLMVDFDGVDVTSQFTYDCSVEFFPPDRDFTDWFNGLNMENVTNVIQRPSELNGFALGRWLGDTVQGFMDFEIYPGISLNRVMGVVLVVGVFALLLTLVI